MESDPAEITQLLQQWADGDGRALDQFLLAVPRRAEVMSSGYRLFMRAKARGGA